MQVGSTQLLVVFSTSERQAAFVWDARRVIYGLHRRLAVTCSCLELWRRAA